MSGRDSHDNNGSREESASDSGRKSQGGVKGKTLFAKTSSDEESDGVYNNNDKDLKELKRRCASLNENVLYFLVTNGISDGTRFYLVVSLGEKNLV